MTVIALRSPLAKSAAQSPFDAACGVAQDRLRRSYAQASDTVQQAPEDDREATGVASSGSGP
jgi:hypothetical protein